MTTILIVKSVSNSANAVRKDALVMNNIFEHIGHDGYIHYSSHNVGGRIQLGVGTIAGDAVGRLDTMRATIDVVVPNGKRILGPRGGFKGFTDLTLAGVVIDPIVHRDKIGGTFYCRDCGGIELSFPKPMRLSKNE